MKLNNFILITLIFLSACGVETGTTYVAPKNQIQSIEFQDKKHTKLVIIINHQPWTEDGLEVIAEATIGSTQSQVDSTATYSTMLRGDKEFSRVIVNVGKIIPNDYNAWSEESYGLSSEEWLKANINQLKITAK